MAVDGAADPDVDGMILDQQVLLEGPAEDRAVRDGRVPADAAARVLPRVTPDIAMAQAHFRLGVWLRRHGNAAEGDAHLAEASRLHPESWNMWRQAADLDEVGKASGEAFWQRVQALGERPYYPPAEL